jgi:hypothetical protein
MRKLLVVSAVAAFVPLLGIAASSASPADAGAAALAGRALQQDLVQPAKGHGHAYGHGKRGNRGLHRGWSIGRGNPHR